MIDVKCPLCGKEVALVEDEYRGTLVYKCPNCKRIVAYGS